jgi:predicted dehydrogenase
MMARPLHVGIIGVNMTGGWAAEAHVPAVQTLEGLTLAAIAASSQLAADEAAHAFEVDKAYADGFALIADPAIDIVTVATRVPEHRDLLLAAIAAGKHVYSEWPLGQGSEQAMEIAQAARAACVKTAIGLQLRGSPVVRGARDLIASGALSRLLSASAFSSTAGFGPDVPPQFTYTEDPASFANLVTIQAAHTLDLVLAVAGAPTSFSAQLSRQFPAIKVGEPGGQQDRLTYDHVLVHGRLAHHVPFVLEVAGGRTGETPFWLDLIGEAGSLRLDGGAPRGVQSGPIGLLLNGERQLIEENGDPTKSAVNVAGVYAALRDDIVHAGSSATGFDHAVRLTNLVEDILVSTETAQVRDSGTWPVH